MKQFGSHLPKGKFIVLGSSGELLPVSRNTNLLHNNDYVTCSSHNSSPDEFYSARTSLPDCEGSGNSILIGRGRKKTHAGTENDLICQMKKRMLGDIVFIWILQKIVIRSQSA